MKRVLFLCNPTCPYSLMAEALLRHIDRRDFEAFSGKVTSEQLDPLSIEVMGEIGLDFSQRSQNNPDQLHRQSFDFVIALDDDTAKQNFPIAGGEVIRWRFDTIPGSCERELHRRILRSVRDQIAQRLRLFTIVHTRPGRTNPSPVRQSSGPGATFR